MFNKDVLLTLAKMFLLELLNLRQKGLRAKVTGCHMIVKAVVTIFNKKFHRYLAYAFM